MLSERVVRWALVGIAAVGLTAGGICWAMQRSDLADRVWAAGTLPVIAALAIGIVRDFLLALGVAADIAGIDSEGIEHHVSQETLCAMADFLGRDR